MKLDFFKMQAQGNDYIYLDFWQRPAFDINYAKLSCQLSDRHFGVGADGIVLIEKSERHDAKMRIFNADGSEGKMCGSALRCVTSYLAQHSDQTEFQIETASGLKTGYVLNQAGDEIKVNLGVPFFRQEESITVHGFEGYLVNIGNEHFVTFVDDFPADIARCYGALIQSAFPDSINVDFVLLKNPRAIEIRFWERGSGGTLACGTGTAAAVFAGIRHYQLDNEVDVTVPGGNIHISYDGENICLAGKVTKVFSGTIEI
ncbi:MAG TPA: diaminopimelate epimerase [Candidatus Cloacimonadota bacterium]|nr:diaminopimelate epimerase [Candidatus Cloacimonadota bacterium]